MRSYSTFDAFNCRSHTQLTASLLSSLNNDSLLLIVPSSLTTIHNVTQNENCFIWLYSVNTMGQLCIVLVPLFHHIRCTIIRIYVIQVWNYKWKLNAFYYSSHHNTSTNRMWQSCENFNEWMNEWSELTKLYITNKKFCICEQ